MKRKIKKAHSKVHYWTIGNIIADISDTEETYNRTG